MNCTPSHDAYGRVVECLPNTGFDLPLMVMAAVGLILCGVGGRLLFRDEVGPAGQPEYWS